MVALNFNSRTALIGNNSGLNNHRHNHNSAREVVNKDWLTPSKPQQLMSNYSTSIVTVWSQREQLNETYRTSSTSLSWVTVIGYAIIFDLQDQNIIDLTNRRKNLEREDKTRFAKQTFKNLHCLKRINKNKKNSITGTSSTNTRKLLLISMSFLTYNIAYLHFEI